VTQRYVLIAVFVAALVVAACGRQVTPNPPGLGSGGAPPGYVALSFQVAEPFNFSNYEYMFVFNTSGSDVTPSTDTWQTNWAGYRIALIARGNGGASSAELVQFVPPKAGKGPPGWLPLNTTPQQLSYNPNSNGAGTQFSMLVEKSVLRGYSPSPSPSSSPTPTPSSLWTFNAFSAGNAASQGQWVFADSLGAGGPIDPQFVSPQLCFTEPFENTYTAQYMQGDPTAQIVSVVIANNPASPSPCP
jgi:hypothetical protein